MFEKIIFFFIHSNKTVTMVITTDSTGKTIRPYFTRKLSKLQSVVVVVEALILNTDLHCVATNDIERKTLDV